jgi:hypothetical protein
MFVRYVFMVGTRAALRSARLVSPPYGVARPISAAALPLVDLLQHSSHERRLVVLGHAVGVAKRRDAGAPCATIEPERIDDPRLYWPKEEAMEGKWTAPALDRVT